VLNKKHLTNIALSVWVFAKCKDAGGRVCRRLQGSRNHLHAQNHCSAGACQSFAPNQLCPVGLCRKLQAGFAGASGACELNNSSLSHAIVLSSCCHHSPSLHAHRSKVEGEGGIMARGRQDSVAVAQPPSSSTRVTVQERLGHHQSWRLPCRVLAQLLPRSTGSGRRWSPECHGESDPAVVATTSHSRW
jgi:hypothetical protein